MDSLLPENSGPYTFDSKIATLPEPKMTVEPKFFSVLNNEPYLYLHYVEGGMIFFESNRLPVSDFSSVVTYSDWAFATNKVSLKIHGIEIKFSATQGISF